MLQRKIRLLRRQVRKHQHRQSDENPVDEIGDPATGWTYKEMIIHIVNGFISRKNWHSTFPLAMQFWEI
jgi:hypothetical protein